MKRRPLSPAAQLLMDAAERNSIITLLQQHDGNITASARRACMDLSVFRRKMARLGIQRQRVLSDGA